MGPASDSEILLSGFEAHVLKTSPAMVEVEIRWAISNLQGPPFALINMPEVVLTTTGEIHPLEPLVDGAPVRDQTVPAGETATLKATVRIADAAWARGCWTVGYAIVGSFEPECINRSDASAN